MRTIRILAILLALFAAMRPASAQFGFGSSEPETPAWKSFKLDPKVRVKLDFRNASIDAILHVLSQASGIAIVKDPALTGAISLQSPKPQSLADAFAMLNSALSLRNCTLRKEGNFLVIKQQQQGMTGPGSGRFPGSSGGAGDDALRSFMSANSSSSITLKVYPLQYSSATQVARIVGEVFALSALDYASMGMGGMGMMGMGGGPGGMMGGGPGGMMGGGPGGMMGGGPGGMMGGFGGMGGFGRRGGGGGGSSSSATVVKASADEYSNSVIVSAPNKTHEQIAELIKSLDRKTDQPQESRVFPLQYASASDVVTVVQNVVTNNANQGRGGTLGARTTTGGGFPMPFGMGGGTTSQGGVVAETRTNSLIVTALHDTLGIVEKVIKEIDKPVTFENRAFVITLANARADDVADILNQSFSSSRSTTNRTSSTNRTSTSTSSSRRTSSSSPSSLGGNSRAAKVDDGTTDATDRTEDAADEPTRAAALAAQGGFGGGFGGFGGQNFGQRQGYRSGQSSSSSSSVGLDASGKVVNVRDLSGDLTAIADTNTNSVIIVTSPQNRQVIESIVEQLDRIPEQVMIETLIVEASLEAADKLGVEWNFTKGSSTGTASFGLKADSAEPQGLRYTLNAGQYGAFMQAIKTDNRFEVLSTPRIFTSNNAQAQINISQSLPYVTNSRVDSNGNYSYSYSFLDVGIVLTVTPRITANGYVTMDVTQTANDFVRYTDFNAPVVNQREADTTVSVKDSETVVLGGIIKNSVSTTTNKVPILGDIPLLGHLFRSTNKSTAKTELLVFLTPRVVRDPEEARRLREETQTQMQSKTLDRLLKTGGIGTQVKPSDQSHAAPGAKDDKAKAAPGAPAEPAKVGPAGPTDGKSAKP